MPAAILAAIAASIPTNTGSPGSGGDPPTHRAPTSKKPGDAKMTSPVETPDRLRL